MMEALDGNAIAGTLFAYFGHEMTTAVGTCAHCDTRFQVAELVVYTRAPGSVGRCRRCGNVVIITVTIRGNLHVDSSALRIEQAPGGR